MKPIIATISNDLHRDFKILCATEDRTMASVLRDLIAYCIQHKVFPRRAGGTLTVDHGVTTEVIKYDLEPVENCKQV